MRKNLFDKVCCEQLLARIESLQPTTAPQWGTMTATEMLTHCNKVHQHLLGPSSSKKSTTAIQYLVRWTVLYLLPKFPKNAKAPKQFISKEVNEVDFENQKSEFAAILRRFPQHHLPVTHHHPYFGSLNTRQWGLSAWKHVDHHLRQFGL